jgi:hypothetical protein
MPIVAVGDWPPILSRSTTMRLREVLSEPNRRPALIPHHLLTGILRCSRCGRPMSAGVNNKKQRYQCNKQYTRTSKRCPGTTISTKHADAAVYDLLVGALRQRMPDNWPRLRLATRRRLVTSVFDHITVQPATRVHQPPADRLDPTPRV